MNKVNFGLKNVYYAKLTESASAAPSFATPKAIPGAVSLSMNHQTAESTLYADNKPYYKTSANNGYTGSLEIAKLTEDFLEDIFGYDTNGGVLLEDANIVPSPFALLFQIEGDASEELYVYYRVFATRPSISAQSTDENGAEAQTATMDISILPIVDPTKSAIDGKVYGRTTDATATSTKTGWFSTVFVPA